MTGSRRIRAPLRPAACAVVLFATVICVGVEAQSGGPQNPYQGGDPDPSFATVPFDRWLDANQSPQIKWETRVHPAELAMEQRLRARLDIQVNGEEVAKRKGRGQLVTLVRIQDSQGRRYEAHNVIDLKSVQQDTNKLNFVVSQDAYMLPGDYQISLGVLDTTTGDHSVARRNLHVNPLKGDPLPSAWRDLPPVEIVRNDPSKAGRLSLPVESKRPVRLELVVNMSPSLEPPAVRATAIPADTVLNGLVSALRVVSQIDVRNGTFHITALNLTKRMVLLEQSLRPPDNNLDWEKLIAALKESDPNVIDVGTLKTRGHGAEFFGQHIRRGIGDGEKQEPDLPQRVMIVLTPPFSFGLGEETRAMELETPSNARVYYLRRHTLPPPKPFEPTLEGRFNRSRRIDPPSVTRDDYAEPVDTLDRVIKPLKPKIFDIYNAEDMRKALAAILEEISKL